MPRAIMISLAVTALAGVALVTLGPVYLRPQFGDPNLERFLGYVVVGLTFALCFQRRLVWATALVIAAAVILEALQLLRPDRDAHFSEMLIKSAGGIVGVGVARLMMKMSQVAEKQNILPRGR